MPENVGIVAAELYIPRTFVSQTDLELKDGCVGKYTIGLGLQKMGFCTGHEDINSICLTVVDSLLKKFNISPKDIGRLEVGTETIIDKSKSTKTVLMSLFEGSGNTDILGVDTTNACYGGTSALFNAVNWVESSMWDGRYALVVAADIAIYAEGPARPTGGCGAVALLIGPNAPIVINTDVVASHSENVYDFYKPNLSSEFPVVDGALSITCYFRALDVCYQRFKKKYLAKKGEEFTFSKIDYALFHAPFSKLVTKAFARLLWTEFIGEQEELLATNQLTAESANKINTPASFDPKLAEALKPFEKLSILQSYADRDLEKIILQSTNADFKRKVEPSMNVSKDVGNLYTGSVYGALISLITFTDAKELEGKRILSYSYGSGLCSTLFSLTVRDAEGVSSIREKVNLIEKLSDRIQVPVDQYRELMTERESGPLTQPDLHKDLVSKGAYFISRFDDKKRRFYSQNV